MTDRPMTDQTGIQVNGLTAARRENALSGADVTLVGTMHGSSIGRALLRHDGRVHVLQTGDTLDGATVTAIAEGVVTLSRDGRTQRLHLTND